MPSFGRHVADAAAAGRLVVQPRMGYSDPARMRHGLEHTRAATAATAGTLTIDSYTRVGDTEAARACVADGTPLNGYPITAHPAERTRALLHGLHHPDFPVQVRHGSAVPEQIIRSLAAAGLDATEGGPVSYCLPYGRTPLRTSVENWARGCELLAELAPPPRQPHMESFGGCMLGQLCPPALLVAISLLEGVFFTQHGIRSVSLSYAQQTSAAQDEEAVRALRRLAAEFLPLGTDWHVVLYTYMGVYPTTEHGALRLLESSAEIAVRSGARRLIVKTAAEAHRIPTVAENVTALRTAAATAARTADALGGALGSADTEVYRQARAFVEAVLGIGADAGRALRTAFARGYLDIPYCLHPDNAGRSRSFIDPAGRLRWSATGAMPVRPDRSPTGSAFTSSRLLGALHSMARIFDSAQPDSGDPRELPGAWREPEPDRAAFADAAEHPPGHRAPDHGEDMPYAPDSPADHALPSPAPGPGEGPAEQPVPQPPPLGEHLRSPSLQDAMLVQQEALAAAREFLRAQGFVELLPPLVGPVTDPGGRGAKALDVDYYGRPYKLMTSAILYKQASLRGFPRLFYVAPNVRMEPPEAAGTGRHLVEFHQLDVEMAGARRQEIQEVAAGLLIHVTRQVWERASEQLRRLGRDELDFAELLSGKVGECSHAEAVARLRALGHRQSEDAEIDWHGERMLSLEADRPFFVNDYPKGSRGFYDREDPDRPGVLRNFDLIAHGGFGELVSGSEREADYATLVTRMRESGENPAKYAWYLNLAREGIPSSAGFGMGVQRLVRFLTGLDALWQVSAYPKLPGVLAP
ncbi:amino acid--tRNA ligase-related protein [Streptomyces sp. SD11]|uniref:amino acid--tRNA ligase-related protein n=1 Tax=Streptomyces sp. SD11 TaxID=3452209 RepID=UPI003F89AD85